MSRTEAQLDASFYQMVHQFAYGSAVSPDDRRRHKRQRFFGIQWVARWDGSRLPLDSEYIEVRCYDLTPAGFSFFFRQRPSFSLLAARFGQKSDQLLHIGAEIVRCVPVLLFPSGRVKYLREGETQSHRCTPTGELCSPKVLVGCRFLQRLS